MKKVNRNHKLILFVMSFMMALTIGSINGYAMQNSGVYNNQPSLDELDPAGCSDEQITEAVMKASIEECAKWLAAMPYNTYQSLIKRDTWLNQEAVTTEYVCESYDEEAEEAILQRSGTKKRKYYEFVLESCELSPPSERFSQETASYFANTSGYFYCYFMDKGTQTASATVTIKGIDTSKPVNSGQTSTSQQRNLTVGVTVTGKYPEGFSASFGNTTSTHADSSTGTYTGIWLPFQYTKKQGYAVSISSSGKYGASGDFFVDEGGKASNGDINYTDLSSHSTTMKVHIGLHAGVGTTASPNTSHAAFLFNVVPAAYQVTYDGNGATAGSTSAQSCLYGKQYQYEKNGFIRQYFLNYQSDGDKLDRTMDKVDYIFAGWGINKTDAAYTEAQTYSNLTAVDKTVLKRYAIWKETSVKLPKTSKTGYTFLHWKGEDGEYEEEAVYVPTKSESMIAEWEANPYHIAYYASREDDTPLAVDDFVYDQEKKLTSVEELGLTRDGYSFVGWESDEAVYADEKSVMNVTALRDETINFYALWQKDNQSSDDKKEETDTTEDGTSEKNSSTIINIYEETQNSYGLTLQQIKELLTQLGKGSIINLKIDGVEYAIGKGQGMTVEIKTVDTGTKSSITIPSTITLGGNSYTVTTIADSALKDNNKIKQVFISDGICKIGDYAFYRCSNLQKIEIPDTVMTIGKYALAKCAKLSQVRFSKGCYEIGEGCFLGDCALVTMNLSGKLTQISSKCCYQCTKLKKITIGTEVTTIGAKAFEGCKKLTNIKLPGKIQKIQKRAFYKCRNLKTVTIKSKVLNEIGIGAFKKCRKTLRFVVPQSRKEAYTDLLHGKY